MKLTIVGLIGLMIGALFGTGLAYVALNSDDGGTSGDHVAEVEPGDAAGNASNADKPADPGVIDDVRELQGLVESVTTRAANAETERDELKAKVKQLQDDLSAVETERDEWRKKAETDPSPATTDEKTLSISFGGLDKIESLRDADWKELGDAVNKMTPLLKQIAESTAKGEQVDPEVMKTVGEHNMKLVRHVFAVQKDLPTHASVNGAYTHPINFVNILVAQLEEAGDPLTDDQKSALTKLGEEYQTRWDTNEKGYTDDTYALVKLMDEADLKQWFVDEMFRVTSPSQNEIARPDETKGLVGLDLYTPGLMFAGIGGLDPVTAATREDLKAAMMKKVATYFAAEETAVTGVAFVFDQWLLDIGDDVGPMTKVQSNLLRTSHILASGRAQIKAVNELLNLLAVSDEVKTAIRNSKTIMLPRIVVAE